MTTEDLAKLTPEEKRIRIAELCGTLDRWVIIKGGYFYRPKAAGYTSNEIEAGIWPEHEAKRHAACASGEITTRRASTPDYLNDLNAMHEAKKIMNPTRVSRGGTYPNERWGVYIAHHNRLCEEQGVSAFNSPADLQADAFLLTLG